MRAYGKVSSLITILVISTMAGLLLDSSCICKREPSTTKGQPSIVEKVCALV